MTPNVRKSKDTQKVKEVPGQESDSSDNNDQATPATATRSHDKGSQPSNQGSQASKSSLSSSKKKLLGEFVAASESNSDSNCKKDKPGSKKRKPEAEPETADPSMSPEFPDDKSVDNQGDGAGEDPAQDSDAAAECEAAEGEEAAGGEEKEEEPPVAKKRKTGLRKPSPKLQKQRRCPRKSLVPDRMDMGEVHDDEKNCKGTVRTSLARKPRTTPPSGSSKITKNLGTRVRQGLANMAKGLG